MSFMIVELIQYFERAAGILKNISRSKFFGNPQLGVSFEHFKIHVEKTTHDSQLSKSHLSFTFKKTVDDVTLRRDDVELLMANLGVFCHSDVEKLPEVLGSTDLLNLFEDELPRLNEVKEAFDVFDENKDGFIDASELQRVFCVLGLKERAEMEDCRKMIGAFDENADGRIDFNEFVKFMENSFC